MTVHHPQRPTRLSAGVRGGQWLNVAAIATWLVCGLPPIDEIINGDAAGWPAAIFVVAYLLYGAALLALLYLPERRIGRGTFVPVLLLFVESLTGITVLYVSGQYLGGTGATSALMVIVAAQLPYIVRTAWTWVFVGVQTLAMMLLFSPSAPLDELISLGLALGGFQLFATASSTLALAEAAARTKLARTNAELHATRALLAETSRVEERLRISRDLHDTLGHHLTALSLQLDVASRLSEGKAADHMRQAHAITRLLLGDVRDVVSSLRDARSADLTEAIRAMALQSAGMAIHLELPEALGIDDSARADALLRCVQEIITNTARHADARNLWIRLESRPDGIALHARDDGRGAPQLTCGNGLKGMRERFEQHAGHVDFATLTGGGFEVRGFIPAATS